MKKQAATPKDHFKRTPAQDRAFREMLANLAEREGRIPNKRLRLFQSQRCAPRRVWAGCINAVKRTSA